MQKTMTKLLPLGILTSILTIAACGENSKKSDRHPTRKPLDLASLTVPATTVTDADRKEVAPASKDRSNEKPAGEKPEVDVTLGSEQTLEPAADESPSVEVPTQDTVQEQPAEESVTPVDEPRDEAPAISPQPLAEAAPFCVDRQAGECLSVVLRVPSSELESSLGIGTMNLMQVSKNFAVAIQEACQEGIEIYTDIILPAGRVKEDTIARVKEARCLVDFIHEEGQALPQLSANEIGLAIRLVDLNVVGQTRVTKPPFVTVSLDNAKLTAQMRDPKIFSIPKGETVAKWRHLRGNHTIVDQITGVPNHGIFGTATMEFNFNASLAMRFDGDRTIAFLNSVFQTNPTTGETPAQAVTGFLTQAGQALSAISTATGAVPQIGAVVMMVTIGMDALRYVCSRDGVECKISRSELQAVENIHTQMGNTAVDARSKALFMDGMKHMPAGIVETIFANADQRDIKAKLNYRR